jgi:hypothetical protein
MTAENGQNFYLTTDFRFIARVLRDVQRTLVDSMTMDDFNVNAWFIGVQSLCKAVMVAIA